MLKSLIVTFLLSFPTAVLADSAECTKLADIIADNPLGSKFVPMTDEQRDRFKKAIPQVDENVTDIVIGKLPDNDEDAFVFGFKADGCEDGSGHLSTLKLQNIIEGGAAS